DTIKISGGTYKEQVTIDSTKDGLTLLGDPDDKPVIVFHDTKAINPTTKADAQDTAKSNKFEKEGTYFDQNGALRVFRAKRVTIENIIVDGGGAFFFSHPGVWYDSVKNETNPLSHGNSGIVLWLAGDAVIRNCEATNAFFGISIKDRNTRGIFAARNPSDNDVDKIVALAGFGKTGNHLIEKSRLHGNSYGIFMESAWDLGSTIRYNLFFDNFHSTASAKDAPTDNLMGAGILFKDDPVSPVAIYNNTFYNNATWIDCMWQAGAYHLIFNNIFGKTDGDYEPGNWQVKEFSYESVLRDVNTELSERYKHNVYDSYSKQNMNAGQNCEINGDMSFVNDGPGSLIPGGGSSPKWKFASDANNRWFEVKYKSTKPDDPDFLEPDWDDDDVAAFIKEQGMWMTDADGDPADLGAIFEDGIPETSVGIKPVQPILLAGTSSISASFNVYQINGSLNNMKVKYARWLGDLPKDEGWGAGKTHKAPYVLNTTQPANIQKLDPPTDDISMGLNALTISGVSQKGLYGFLEVIIEGEDQYGSMVTTGVGFLPYRELKYTFSIKAYEKGTDKELEKVRVGEAVDIKIVPLKKDGSKISDGEVVDVVLNLFSAESFKDGDGKKITEMFIEKIPVTGITKTITFIKLPATGIEEFLAASGTYKDNPTSSGEIIRGNSDKLRILPGYPAKIKFKTPSNKRGLADIINPNVVEVAKLQLYDKDGNVA
ncbi:MAG: NosD domain-containing protein, partial [Fibrobacter sp.]|nr:NosD domain-containing protein [Fibrobacter sp.]